MIKNHFFLTLTLVAFNYVHSQCPNGTVHLNSQQAVDDFIMVYPNCTEVNSIFISGNDTMDLSGLSIITTINNNLSINGASNLLTLQGLDNISSVGGALILNNNSALNDLSALNNLTQIGKYLRIRQMNAISNINFLNNLLTIGEFLEVDNNDLLENVDGLNSLNTIGQYIKITNNDSLSSIIGMNSIGGSLDYINISINDALTEIIGFNNINNLNSYLTIGSNNALSVISGFTGLQTVGDGFFVRDNSSLSTLDNFQNLQIINGDFELKNNPFLNNFNAFNTLNEFSGNVIFENNHSLIDFSNLSSLNSIGGDFSVLNNDGLINFQGLQSLQTINGNFACKFNDLLQDFSGLNSLNSIDSFFIQLNENLINFDGLNSLINTEAIDIQANQNLLSLEGLNNLQVINGSLTIGGYLSTIKNSLLTTLSFTSLTQINGDLIITGNPNIIDISGFNSLNSIDGNIDISGNSSQIQLSGLNSISTIDGNIEIRFNESLQSIIGFSNLFEIGGFLKISNNDMLGTVLGFQNLNVIQNYLLIEDNDSLINFPGFQSLTTVNDDVRIGSSLNGNGFLDYGNSNLSNLSGLNSLSNIGGDLSIGSNQSLLNVDALNNLVSIGGNLVIFGNNNNTNSSQDSLLSNLNGLSGLSNVNGDIILQYNSSLSSISLPSLQMTNGHFIIKGNQSLINLVGLESLTKIRGQLKIDANQSLIDLQGLDNLQEVEALIIMNNDSLNDLNSLSSLQIILNSESHLGLGGYESGILRVSQNNSIVSLNGLESLSNLSSMRITTNQSLIDISAISEVNFSYAYDVSIFQNPNLATCSYPSICNYYSFNDEGFAYNQFGNNLFGCNSKDEIIADCSTGLNSIEGNLQFDIGSDGCDNNDLPIFNTMIIAESGSNSYSTFTLSNGFYQLFLGEGNFSTSTTYQMPNYYNLNPATFTSNFVSFGNTDTANFCIEPIGSINDLNITIIPPFDEPRPGFDTSYQIIYSNIGTTQLSGDITFQFDDSKIQFLNASETVASQTANALTFDYTNLNPFETRTIDLDFNVFPPPTTNIDDELISTVGINPVAGDETQNDNTFELNQTVIGSYDPNDIQILEGEQVHIDDADEYLHFLIRFQNTGTASAINVRVEHILDSKLDWTTMQLQSLSHDGRVEITDGSDVQFIFNNINLPAQTTDEEASIGYIAFKIKPKDDVVLGDIISGVADIYFDFNPPIITNTATTEFVDNLGDERFEMNEISIYPNPTDGLLHVKSNSAIDKIEVFDMLGRQLLSQDFNQKNVEMDLSKLQNGVYFIKIKSNNTTEIKKIIKD